MSKYFDKTDDGKLSIICKKNDSDIGVLLHALLIYSEGEIRTVKDAKQFIRECEDESIPT